MLLSILFVIACLDVACSRFLEPPPPLRAYPLAPRYPYGTHISSGSSEITPRLSSSSHPLNNSRILPSLPSSPPRPPVQRTSASYGTHPSVGITPAPVATKAVAVSSPSRAGGGTCEFGDSLCNSTGITATVDGPTIPGLDTGLRDQCMLWDKSCSGNKTKALNNFFDNTGGYLLFENACFVNPNSTWCAKHDAKVLPEFAKIKSWMRSPQCLASSSEYLRNLGQTAVTPSAEMGLSCCNTCYLSGKNVDLYYWPQPGANSSCLNIVGETVNSLDYGATTSYDSDLTVTTTYWGCTAQTPVSGDSIIRTAQITTVGSLTYKAPLVNPWSSACAPSTDSATNISSSSIRVRPQSLVPSSVTHDDGTPVTTVVTNGYTFTSPFVYANFLGIGAGDWCGKTTIRQTMLSFAPGELSTIAGPLYSGISPGHSRPDLSTQVFNFADLPCPPQSVMEENWYKPEPGEPYRPLIAIPSKVRALNPFFSSCTDLWFDAVDPPRALDPQGILEQPGFANVPGVRSGNGGITANVLPQVHQIATAMVPPENNPPVASPSPVGTLTAPRAANTNLAIKTPSPDPPNDPAASQDSPESQASPDNSHHGHHNLAPSVIGQETAIVPPPSPPADPGSFNPQNVSPQQMSKINQALNTDSSSNPSHPNGQDSGSNGTPEKAPSPGVSNSNNSPANPPAAEVPTVISVGNHAVKVAPSGVQADNVPIAPGPTPVPLPGNSAAAMVNNDQNAVVVGNHIYQVSAPQDVPGAAPVTTILPDGAKAVIFPTPAAGGEGSARDISIFGTTLTPGAPPIIVTTNPPSGSPGPLTLSLDPNNNIIYNPVAHSLPLISSPNETPLPITSSILNNQPLVVLPHGQGVSIAGTTLNPTGGELMISGTAVSLLGTSALVIGGSSTVALPSDPSLLPNEASSADQPITTSILNGHEPIVVLPHGQGVSIAGTTLSPTGGEVMISGTEVSLLGTSALVIGGSSTVAMPSDSALLPNEASSANQPITTSILNNQPLVVLPHGEGVSIAGTTLSPTSGRDEVMISGTEVSLLGTSALVIGSSTITLPTSDSTGLTGGSRTTGASASITEALSPTKTNSKGKVSGADSKYPSFLIMFFLGTFSWAITNLL